MRCAPPGCAGAAEPSCRGGVEQVVPALCTLVECEYAEWNSRSLRPRLMRAPSNRSMTRMRRRLAVGLRPTRWVPTVSW